MPLSVEKVYSDALFALAREEGDDSLTETLSQLKALRQVLSDTPDFVRLMSTPTVSGAEKQELVSDAFKGNVSEYVFNFISLLVEKGRLSYFPRIVGVFEKDYNALMGIAVINVTTARPLSEKSRAALIQKAERDTGMKVSLKEKLDPSLIGGVIVDYGTRRIDGSVKTRLEQLSRELVAPTAD